MAETIRLEVDDRRLVQLIRNTGGREPVRIVADGVEYGIFVEMGTSTRSFFGIIRKARMAARPFLMPAWEAVRPGFLAAWRQVKSLERKESVVENAANDVERLAKANAPVDTGALRASIHVVAGDVFVVEFESERD